MNALRRYSTVFGLGIVLVLFPQDHIPYQALLIDVNGTVTVRRADRVNPQSANWGMQLNKGDRIETGENSRASMLFVNNMLVRLGPSSIMTIEQSPLAAGGSDPGTLDVGTAVQSQQSLVSFHGSEEGEPALLAGLRSGGTDEIFLVSPRNSKISSIHPRFRWHSTAPFDRYAVSVYSDSGIVWSQLTNELSMSVPIDASPLVHGRTYFWNVKGQTMFRESQSEDVEFTVDDPANVARVNSAVQDIGTMFEGDTSSHSYKYIVGSYYEQEGYLDRARDHFEALQAAYPEAPTLHQILGNLYAKMGLKDQAITEFQKALQTKSPE